MTNQPFLAYPFEDHHHHHPVAVPLLPSEPPWILYFPVIQNPADPLVPDCYAPLGVGYQLLVLPHHAEALNLWDAEDVPTTYVFHILLPVVPESLGGLPELLLAQPLPVFRPFHAAQLHLLFKVDLGLGAVTLDQRGVVFNQVSDARGISEDLVKAPGKESPLTLVSVRRDKSIRESLHTFYGLNCKYFVVVVSL